MRRLVGVADMAVSADPGDLLVTHALGSCLGVTAHDPAARVGGLLHVMLPLSRIHPDKARRNPLVFVDTGVPALLRAVLDAGGVKARLVVKVAGGASRRGVPAGPLAIGERNWIVLKRLLWKNGILVAADEVGGSIARGMSLEIDSGRVTLSTAGKTRAL